MAQVIVIIVAIAVTALIAPHAIAAVANFAAGTTVATVGAAGVTFTAAASTSAIVAGTVVGGAIAGAAGSIVSQGVAMGMGVQDKFSWKAVAMGALSGAVGGGLRMVPGLNTAAGASVSVASVAKDVARGALGSVITQGVGVATNLQEKFDWTSVAVAGVMSGVGGAVGRHLDIVTGSPEAYSAQGITNSIVSGTAGAIAGAATRTLINGSDFGDNFMALLPDVIGQTVGNAIARGVQTQIGKTQRAKQDAQVQSVARESGIAFEVDPDGRIVTQDMIDIDGVTQSIDGLNTDRAIRAWIQEGRSGEQMAAALSDKDIRGSISSWDRADYISNFDGSVLILAESTHLSEEQVGQLMEQARVERESGVLDYVNQGAVHLADLADRNPLLTGMAIAGAQAAFSGGGFKPVVMAVGEAVLDDFANAAQQKIKTSVSGYFHESVGFAKDHADLLGSGAAFGATFIAFGGPKKVMDAARDVRTLFASWGKKAPPDSVKVLAGRTEGAKIGGPLPPLRLEYVEAVRGLSNRVVALRGAGKSPEYIARAMHSERRSLGVKYKDMTSPEELARIYKRNIDTYDDPLGPSIEWLRKSGKSWEQITKSALRPGGKDMKY